MRARAQSLIRIGLKAIPAFLVSLLGMLYPHLVYLGKLYLVPNMTKESLLQLATISTLICVMLLTLSIYPVFFLINKIKNLTSLNERYKKELIETKQKYNSLIFVEGIYFNHQTNHFHCANEKCREKAKIVPINYDSPFKDKPILAHFECCTCDYIHYPRSPDGTPKDPYHMHKELISKYNSQIQ